MQKVYFISGLGADCRIFSFLDLSFCEPVNIDWIPPLPKESLEQYSLRLRDKIPDSHPVIVGISMGGMIITEMAKADKNVKGIIIASNKTEKEFPSYLRIGKYFPLYKWVPGSLALKFMLLIRKIMGAKGREQRKIQMQIIRDTDTDFAKWAIWAILHWTNKKTPSNLVHIHGTNDRVLPHRLVKADYLINGGSHTMTLDHHKEVSDILKKLIL
jgi:pimeloyl-ACP methyl ester carboxylesterase